MVDDLPHIKLPSGVYEGCMLGKHHNKSILNDLVRQASCPLELVHGDICGHMITPSVGRPKYLLTFIDDFSRFLGYSSFNPRMKPLRKLKNFNHWWKITTNTG